AVLGTIEELFPHQAIQRDIVSQLSHELNDFSISAKTEVTAEMLTLVTAVRSNGTTTYTNDDLKNLHLLTELKELSFTVNFKFESTDFFWQQVAHLKKLEILKLTNPAFKNGENAEYTIDVPYLPNLKELDLYWWGATADENNAVAPGIVYDGSSINKANLPKLEHLNLAVTPLQMYDNIAELDTLINLNVSMAYPTLHTIEFIENLHNLQQLNLNSNSIVDFSPLAKITANWDARNQRKYYAKDQAQIYYNGKDAIELPAQVTGVNGEVLDATAFLNLEPVTKTYTYDDVKYTIDIKGLEEIELKEYKFWFPEGYKNGLITPYKAKGVRIEYSAEFNGNPINGYFLWEIKFQDGVPDEKPEIHGATDLTIKVGETFDPMSGVNVTDKEDDMTGTPVKLEITGDVDTTKAGKYVVTYTATDSFGNITVLERLITVNEQMSGMNSIPTITLIDPNLKLKQEAVFDALAWATATDAEDGNLTTKLEVISNTVDTAISGTYEVTYKVTDSLGASTTATMSVYVDEKPEIHGATDVAIKVGDLFNPLQGVTVADKEDDATATLVKLAVTGDVDTSKAGKYVVTYTATDSMGNVTTVERLITVNGEMNGMNSIPTITLINPELTLKQDEDFDALAWATAADEEDGDLTAKIEVVKNTVNPAVSEMYEVTYKVTDSLGASTTATMSVYIDEKPEIHGATDLTIKVGETFDPMNGITVSDKEDGTRRSTIQLDVTGEVDTTTVGKYQLMYTAIDSMGNVTTVERLITVGEQVNGMNNIPTITLINPELTLKQDEVFDALAWATAADKEDGDLTAKIEVVKNTVNPAV
ncbi:MAG: immunoglobulin-like domain-containing protein, partial [Culicoidibacterales bacterium]